MAWWLWVGYPVAANFLYCLFLPLTSKACEKSNRIWKGSCVSILESQETHVRHWPPWYDLNCLFGLKQQCNQLTNWLAKPSSQFMNRTVIKHITYFQAMFYADQLLSKAPPATQDTVLHELQPPDRSSRTSPMQLGPITSIKKMSGKVM